MKNKLAIFILAAVVLVAGVAVWISQPGQSETPVSAPASQRQSLSPNPSTVQTASVAQPQPAQTNVVKELSPLVGAILDETKDIKARVEAAHGLKARPTSEDLAALYGFLSKRNPLDETREGHYLKNVVMDALCKLNPPLLGLGELLMQVYQDRGQNQVLRDYALQHLVPYYQLAEQTKAKDPETQKAELERVQDVMWQALSETDSTIAGTALLDLSYLALGNRPEFDRNRIAAKALELAQTEGGGELTRITALQVCVDIGNEDALPVAMDIVQSGATVSLRISAVAVLGAFGAGNKDVKILLDNLPLDQNERLVQPVRQALKKIAQQEARITRKI